ncbi:MAG TPA: hypothetical protein VJA63_00635 [Candidatus Paceibacterota bacterium]
MSRLSGKELVKKIGLPVFFVLATFISFVLLISILKYFKFSETVAVGLPEIFVVYFWGGYFLRKRGWPKALGSVLILVAIALNLVFISSPYNNAGEFKETRVFLLPLILSGVFLVLQEGKPLRLLGVLAIILAILGAFWGALFFAASSS